MRSRSAIVKDSERISEGSLRDPNDRALRSHSTPPSLPFVRRPRRLFPSQIKMALVTFKLTYKTNKRLQGKFETGNSFLNSPPCALNIFLKLIMRNKQIHTVVLFCVFRIFFGLFCFRKAKTLDILFSELRKKIFLSIC